MASLAASRRASAAVQPFTRATNQPRPLPVRLGLTAFGKQRCVVVRAQADGEQLQIGHVGTGQAVAYASS
jgi:hypothetical protein